MSKQIRRVLPIALFVLVGLTLAIVITLVAPGWATPAQAQGTLPPGPEEIPEPVTLILLGGGVVTLAGYLGLRRRNR